MGSAFFFFFFFLSQYKFAYCCGFREEFTSLGLVFSANQTALPSRQITEAWIRNCPP
jgi:hypothetical protein